MVDTSSLDLKWTAPDDEGVVAFLCGEKSFNEDRVRKTLAKLKAAKGSRAKTAWRRSSAPPR